MNSLDPRFAAVTERVVRRSKDSRQRYLDLIAREGEKAPTGPAFRAAISRMALPHPVKTRP